VDRLAVVVADGSPAHRQPWWSFKDQLHVTVIAPRRQTPPLPGQLEVPRRLVERAVSTVPVPSAVFLVDVAIDGVVRSDSATPALNTDVHEQSPRDRHC
jgi:hypothetical protein